MAFGLETAELGESTAVAEEPPLKEQFIDSLPNSIEVSEPDSDSMRIKEDWFRWHHAILLLGLMLVVGPLVILAPTAELSAADSSEQMPPILIACFAIAIVSAGYWALAGLINSTRITVGPNRLVRKLGPLPWPGHLELDVSDIDQFYVTQGFTSQRRMTPWD